MRNFRTTIIAAVAIPASIVGTFTLMKAFGFTLNNMTMLALSLATGIVIDDAIVVLENIFRYVEEKKVPPREAASKATSEIGLAVMATTLSLVVIFLPVAFIDRTDRAIFLQLRHSLGFRLHDFDVYFLHLNAGPLRHLAALHARAPQNLQSGASTSPSTAGMAKMLAGVLAPPGYHPYRRRRGGFGGFAFSARGQGAACRMMTKRNSVNVRLPRGTNFARTNERRAADEGLRKLPEVEAGVRDSTPETQFLRRLTPLGEEGIPAAVDAGCARFCAANSMPGPAFGRHDVCSSSTAAQDEEAEDRTVFSCSLKGRHPGSYRFMLRNLLHQVKTIPGIVESDSNFEATAKVFGSASTARRRQIFRVSIDSLASTSRLLVGGDEATNRGRGSATLAVKEDG